MDRRYFAALDQYGPGVVDGVTFHGYAVHPERNADIVHTLQEMMNKHASVRGKPIYDSEDAWPGGGALTKLNGAPDWDLRSAWMARSMILTASLGVKQYIFFGWALARWDRCGRVTAREDCTIPNKDGKAGYLCPTAPAYEQIRSWLLGAVFDKECEARDQGYKSGPVWTCDFTKNNGSYHGRFAWAAGTDVAPYEPEKQFAVKRELDGSSTEVKKGTIQIGPKPVLLEMK